LRRNAGIGKDSSNPLGRRCSDAKGTSVHQTGPKEWQAKIGKIPVAVG
jgi:hypothetical protein